MFKHLFYSTVKKYKRMMVGVAGGVFAFQLLMGSMFDSFAPIFSGGEESSAVVPDALGVFTGGANMFDPIGWLGVGYAHPIPILLIVAWVMVVSASSIAKEVEDGTSEILFTRPVRRSAILSSRLAHCFGGLIIILLASYFGSLSGIQFSDTLREQINQVDILVMVASYVPMAVLIGALGFFVSSVVSQRSLVTSIVLAFVVASYFLNFAGQLWSALSDVVGLSIFYQTVPANWATGDINVFAMILVSLMAACLIIASYVMLNRRNITT